MRSYLLPLALFFIIVGVFHGALSFVADKNKEIKAVKKDKDTQIAELRTQKDGEIATQRTCCTTKPEALRRRFG